MQQERILSALKEPLGLSEDARLIPLTGGEVNHVYRLTDRHKDLVVKWTGEDAFSGINRFHQFVLQEQVSQRLLAPEPVWLSDDECLWVEKFIEGPTLSRSGTDIPAALGRILASIHDQPITARPLQLTKRWQHYIDSAKLSSTDPRVHRANELNERLHLDYEDDGVLALCHNDLSADHIVCGEHSVIVDWEYAAMGNRYFDLAGCALINKLSDDACDELCQAYAQAASVEIDTVLRLFRQQREVVTVTNALWEAALNVQLKGARTA
ncbi:choline/ethanolamine kinase family protein [Alteromonas antoniana]|uniref:choline/ethanolamine kinase family protein n=1 Tax=Alteromonas antoniana TaxID=2803813 RepID=UPI001C446367|nr:choline/ethanolamine kinase family protein [Alteromonas antoniana]